MTDVVDLYLRKSNKDGRRSVGRQESDLTAEAADAGLTIGLTFIDPDLSASRFATKGRPDYEALLAHIRSGKCRIVGIVESSRGSRRLSEWSSFLDLCREKKVKVWVQTHDRVYDLSRRRDWKVLADDGLDAANESEVISERTLSGKRAALAKGLPPGRNVYGHLRVYEATPRGPKIKEIIPHPDQAPIVAELVDRVVKGESLTAIANDLNDRGIPSPGGAAWVGVIVRQTVMRPHHIGKLVHHGQVQKASWGSIVDEAQWRRAVGILTKADRRTQRGTALAHWLSGVVLCGACRQEHLRPVARRSRYTCYGCWGVSVSMGTLENVVEAAILARLDRADAREAFVARPDSEALARAEDHLRDLENQLEQNERDYRTNVISARLAGARETELAPQIEAAQAEVNRLSLPPELAGLDAVDVVRHWKDYAPAKKRAVVRRLVNLEVGPAAGRGPVFDPTRLDGSRWCRDTLTWGERRRADTQTP